MQRLVVFLLFVLAVSGCVSPAGKLDDSLIAQIKDGVSNRSEVEKLLGPPKSEITGSNGKRVAVYTFRRTYEKESSMAISPDRLDTIATSAQRQVHLRTLSLLYGKDDRVELRHLYESNTGIAANLAGAKMGAPVGPAQLAAITKGLTQRADLVKLLGNPLFEHLNPDGDLTLIWLYLKGTGTGEFAPEGQRLLVVTSPGGIVRDFRVVADSGGGQKR